MTSTTSSSSGSVLDDLVKYIIVVAVSFFIIVLVPAVAVHRRCHSEVKQPGGSTKEGLDKRKCWGGEEGKGVSKKSLYQERGVASFLQHLLDGRQSPGHRIDGRTLLQKADDEDDEEEDHDSRRHR